MLYWLYVTLAIYYVGYMLLYPYAGPHCACPHLGTHEPANLWAREFPSPRVPDIASSPTREPASSRKTAPATWDSRSHGIAPNFYAHSLVGSQVSQAFEVKGF